MTYNQPLTHDTSRLRKFHRIRNVLVGAVIVVLLLVVASTSLSNLGTKASSSLSTVNSPSTPVSGEQLFTAYTANQTLADATYTQKVVYIRDTVDPGDVGSVDDPNVGQYFSTVNFGQVVLYWSDQSQALQISPGQQILAKCTVKGMEISQGGDYLLYLMNCTFANAGQNS